MSPFEIVTSSTPVPPTKCVKFSKSVLVVPSLMLPAFVLLIVHVFKATSSAIKVFSAKTPALTLSTLTILILVFALLLSTAPNSTVCAFVNWLIEQNGIDNVGRQDNASKANEKANTLVKAYETAQTSEAKNLNEAKVRDGDYSDISVALLRHVGTEVFPIGFSHNVAIINRFLNELYKELDVNKTTEEQRSETENVTKIVKDVRQSQSALKAAA